MSNRNSGAPPRPLLRDVLALALVVAVGGQLSAQTGQYSEPAASSLDPRWAPWLGCWQADVVAMRSDPSGLSVTCVVPLAGTTGVQQVTVTRGAIVSRRQYIADGRANSFDENGCHGTRTVRWALKSRRVYMRSSYSCNAGLAGTSTAVLSLTASGDWLNVENMRAGQGSIGYVDHWHDAGVPAGLPSEVAGALQANRLAIATARATAALALGVDDVIDALQFVEPTTVQSWIAASGQQFSLSGEEVAMLTRANVPRGVLQAMVGWTPQPGAYGPGYDPNAYLNSVAGTVYAAQQPQVIVIQPQPQQPQVYVSQEQTQEPQSPTYCTAVACYPTNQNTGYNGYPYDYSTPCYPYGCPFFSAPIVTGAFVSPFFPNVRRGPFGRVISQPIVRVPPRPIGHGPVAVGRGAVVVGRR
jgi:hypothetical protein